MIPIINIYNLLKKINCENYLFSNNAKVCYASLVPSDQKKLDSSILYIGELSQIIDNDGVDLINFVCVNDMHSKSACSHDNLNLIIIKQPVEKAELLDTINSYINAYDNYLDNRLFLYDALLTANGLTGTMNSAYSIFKNPLVLVNQNYRLIAHPPNMDVKNNPDWNETIKNGAASYDFIQRILKTDPEAYENLSKTQEPILAESPAFKNRTLVINVSVNQKPIAFICLLEYEKNFDEFDFLLLKSLSEIVSSEIQNDSFYKQNKGLFYEHFYHDLLQDNFSNVSLVKERAEKLFSNLYEEIVVLSVKAKDMSNNRLYPFYRDNLEKIIRDCHSIIYENEVVLIIRRKNRILFSESVLEAVQNYLYDNKLIGGISYYFEDIVKLKEYYQQSIKAMELGNQLNPKKNLYFYNDYMAYHFFDIARKTMDNLKSFSNPFIKQLSDYDKKNNTSYKTSLEVYLKNGNKLLNASRKLNIHRNTMDYHIHKINDILDIDVNDPKTSQNLLISFMVLEYINATEH
ncbi:PucR family transcriptional regulator [Acetobacterium tundrae]|uniref:PucR C-terminal helix-turn-helix domain-containing protein n=1 Tax=Acetobacterium tundrae TaxID=132932 RepID=A0ABR6WK39_9FIRM|nr:helix-turn-helix domain-containing protein [Acetobacterium tundrae]MBC3796875.1 hypothetical protein [Acetobacterium tundrae]